MSFFLGCLGVAAVVFALFAGGALCLRSVTLPQSGPAAPDPRLVHAARNLFDAVTDVYVSPVPDVEQRAARKRVTAAHQQIESLLAQLDPEKEQG